MLLHFTLIIVKQNLQCESKHFTSLRFSGSFTTTAKNFTEILHIYFVSVSYTHLTLPTNREV